MSFFEKNIDVSDENDEYSDHPDEDRDIIESNTPEENTNEDTRKWDISLIQPSSSDNTVDTKEDNTKEFNTLNVNCSNLPTSHTMSAPSKDCSQTISKTSSPQEPPKLGFSIAQIMGYMSRGVNFKDYEESPKTHAKKEVNDLKRENVTHRDMEKCQNSFESNKLDLEKSVDDSLNTETLETRQDTSKLDSLKYSKHDNSVWRPQPCRKYMNAAAFHAVAAASALSSDASSGSSLPNVSSSSNDNVLLSPSAESPPGPISAIQQALPFHNANIPLPHQDISTLALLRQYSLMNFNNPWKTASLLSSYGNLLGLHSQIGLQHQKNFAGECNGLPPSITGIPYPTNNNNTAHTGSSMASNFEARNLPPPLNLMGNITQPDSMPQFDLRSSPEGIPNPLIRSPSMTIPSCIDNTVRSSPSSIYPTQGYPTLKLSENNLKAHSMRNKSNMLGQAKANGLGNSKPQTKGKDLTNLDPSNPGSKSSTSQQKTFPCTECGKVFNAHYNLTRHMPVHTGKMNTII